MNWSGLGLGTASWEVWARELEQFLRALCSAPRLPDQGLSEAQLSHGEERAALLREAARGLVARR